MKNVNEAMLSATYEQRRLGIATEVYARAISQAVCLGRFPCDAEVSALAASSVRAAEVLISQLCKTADNGPATEAFREYVIQRNSRDLPIGQRASL